MEFNDLDVLLSESMLLAEAATKKEDPKPVEKAVYYSVDKLAELVVHKIREDGLYISSFSDAGDPTYEYVGKVIKGDLAYPKITPEDKAGAEKLLKAYQQPYNGMAVYKKTVVAGGQIDTRSIEAVVGSMGKTMQHYKLIDTYAEKLKERKEKEAAELQAKKDSGEDNGFVQMSGADVKALVEEIRKSFTKEHLGKEGELVKFKLKTIRTVNVDSENDYIRVKIAGTTSTEKLVLLNIPYNSFDKNFEGEDGKPVMVIDKVFVKFPAEEDLKKMKQTKLADSKYELDDNYTVAGLVGGFRIAKKKDDGTFSLIRNLDDLSVTALKDIKENIDNYHGVTIVSVSPNTQKDVDPKMMKIALYNQGVAKLLKAKQYLGEKGDTAKARLGGIRMVGVISDDSGKKVLVTGKSADGRWFTTDMYAEDREAIGKLFKKFPSAQEIENADYKVMPDNLYSANVGGGFAASVVSLRIKYKDERDVKPINPLSMEYEVLKELIHGDRFFKDCIGLTKLNLSAKKDVEEK